MPITRGCHVVEHDVIKGGSDESEFDSILMNLSCLDVWKSSNNEIICIWQSRWDIFIGEANKREGKTFIATYLLCKVDGKPRKVF